MSFLNCFRKQKAGINFEHSWGDGVSVLRFANEICEDSFEHELETDSSSSSSLVEPLPFDLSAVQSELNEGDSWLKRRGEELTATELRVNGFGKKFFKSRKVRENKKKRVITFCL